MLAGGQSARTSGQVYWPHSRLHIIWFSWLLECKITTMRKCRKAWQNALRLSWIP